MECVERDEGHWFRLEKTFDAWRKKEEIEEEKDKESRDDEAEEEEDIV